MRLNPICLRRPEARRVVIVVVVAALVMIAAMPTCADAAVADLAQAGAEETKTVLNRIRNWIMAVLGTWVLVFVTLGCVRYVSSSGDPGQIEKAKGAFKSAGIGFVLALAAPLVVEILQGFVA